MEYSYLVAGEVQDLKIVKVDGSIVSDYEPAGKPRQASKWFARMTYP